MDDSPAPLAHASAEPTAPFPPRCWWLKRLSLGCAALAALLLGVWAAWGGESDRRLARELEPVIKAGQPVNAPGLNPPRIGDDENGAPLYRQALAFLKQAVPSPANSNLDYTGYPPFPPRWHRLADQAIPPNGPSLALVRQARGFRRFDWGIRATSPAYAVLLPYLNDARALANFVGDAALYAHLHGDDFEALERIRDVRKLAQAVEAPRAFVVTHLVALGCDAVAVSRLEVIAPGLTIGADGPATNPATGPAARPASPAQVRALISELLDDAPAAEGLRLANAAERAAQLDMAEWFGRNVPVLRPMFRLDAVRLARKNEAMIRIAELPNWPAVRDAMKREPAVAQVPPPQTTLPSYYVGPGRGPAASHTKPVDYTRFLSTDVCTSTGFSSGRAVEQTMRLCAERRMTAVSLAARLYRADHDGAFPPSLGALVPAYLPHVPGDPFSPENRPLGYVVARGALPDGGDRPLVYSVGRDGIDDTAAGGLSGLPRTPCLGVDSKTPDQWRDLARWTPALTPQEQQAEEAQEKAAATQPAK